MRCSCELLRLHKGKTFQWTVRWETEPIVYRPIAAVEEVAPLVLSVPAHGLVSGWRVAISGVRGMVELNATHTPPWDEDYHEIRVIDENSIEINEVNAVGFRPYREGGYLQYNRPMDLDACQALMVVKSHPGGKELARWSTQSGHIVLDDAAKTIVVTVAAFTTESFTWHKGVYELEIRSPEGLVYSLFQGAVEVREEIATPAIAEGVTFASPLSAPTVTVWGSIVGNLADQQDLTELPRFDLDLALLYAVSKL